MCVAHLQTAAQSKVWGLLPAQAHHTFQHAKRTPTCMMCSDLQRLVRCTLSETGWTGPDTATRSQQQAAFCQGQRQYSLNSVDRPIQQPGPAQWLTVTCKSSSAFERVNTNIHTTVLHSHTQSESAAQPHKVRTPPRMCKQRQGCRNPADSNGLLQTRNILPRPLSGCPPVAQVAALLLSGCVPSTCSAGNCTAAKHRHMFCSAPPCPAPQACQNP